MMDRFYYSTLFVALAIYAADRDDYCDSDSLYAGPDGMHLCQHRCKHWGRIYDANYPAGLGR